MLSKKETLILKLLYENKHRYLTSQEVASGISVSNRTARKYLHSLNEQLEQIRMGNINAKPGHGYQLKLYDGEAFESFYLSELKNKKITQDSCIVQESKDRQYTILKHLFFDQGPVYVDHIAEELFVSRSTVSNELVEIKKQLKPYNIVLKHKSNKGIYLVGKEQSIRHFIMNYFFVSRLHDNLYTFSIYGHLLEGINIEEIVIIVLDECRENKLRLSDFIIYNLVLHIGLAVKRIKSGFKMDSSVIVDITQDLPEYQTARAIIQRIEASQGIVVPTEEAHFIALHLLSKTSSANVFKKTEYKESEIRQQLLAVLSEIDQSTGYKLHKDSILIEGLMLHFIPLFRRLQEKRTNENPLMTDIKQQYQDIYEMTVSHLNKMAIFQTYPMNENEWAYIAIHFIAAVERFCNEQKAHVLVICATGLGSSQMLKNRLERELGSKIYIEKVISYYEIVDQDLSEIDLIISSINVPTILLGVPIVTVSVLLNEQHIESINQAIAADRITKKIDNLQFRCNQTTINDRFSAFEQCVSEELFFVANEYADKTMILTEMLRRIEQKEERALKETFMKQIKLRESYSSVAFSNYLAVPHPIEPLTNAAHVAIAIQPEGFYWDQAHPNIQLVVLLSPDKFGHLNMDVISQALEPILDNREFQQAILKCTSCQSFMEILKNETPNERVVLEG